ncbi:hydroxyethylthiazole kinase [Aequitasia blattaphilus]|uniref:Hydroxyethylthiazole kinase n=1 Tax=Aequitasia blattaphilus TaxID=2949332 RepID=A0ABT1EBS5_9FIRM|nr:hydroxyethylthiazole kinase [Aequitasia blattaphilus]MCP1103295.1 hydroxyethylthiazole kinase [Aequitasia blattaphilus]MCR8615935.1 hydroxyethylthiazole kinase [Aequitasia blattaphilus]
MARDYFTQIEKVRQTKPLIHHITNYVTVNDCANITLGIGASPIMADDCNEAGEIASIASALVLNIGTLNERTIPSMLSAGKAANTADIPVVLDPVGAGASKLRNDTVSQLISNISFAVIRGNISEIRYISGLQANTKGVDASLEDQMNLSNNIQLAQQCAQKLNCVIAITGETDVISDGKTTVSVANGVAMLSALTGTGCMCSSLIGSYCGAHKEQPFAATVAALLSMGIAGEIAFEKAGQLGNGSFHMALHDAISTLTPSILLERAKIYENEN